MKIDPKGFPLPLSEPLIQLLELEIAKVDVPQNAGVVINFRDPGYSVEAGGYHPVEISITADGRLLYVTDFAYVGRPPFAELAKELDFDTVVGQFQQFGHDYPLEQGREMFKIWQENFCAYHAMDVFQVSVVSD